MGLVLGVTRQSFRYRLLNLLAAVSDLQACVFRQQNRRPDNYGYWAVLLEGSFLKLGRAVLLVYDIPPSAVRKVDSNVSRDARDWSGLIR
jgi:hypothetical protein